MEKNVLGNKIKTLRKSLKITQASLAGKKITRNMLSKIESGVALPSLDTLSYLAKGLGVPVSYLLSESDDLIFYKKRDIIDKIYRSYDAKSYKACIDIIRTFDETDSELDYIAANAYFELARTSICNGSFISAAKYFEISTAYCKKTRLNAEHIIAKISMYNAIIKNVQAPLLEFDPGHYLASLQNIVELEFFKYMILDFSYPFETPSISLHMDAKKKIKEHDYTEAIKLLLNAVEIIKKGTYNAFIIFSVYTDLEYCYKQTYDYENAYLYSSKRMTLLENFNT